MLSALRNQAFLKWGITGLLLITMAGTLSGCSKQASAPADVWGRAEAKEVDINTKVPGRVIELLVKEGDKVEQGQLLARIDARDLIAKAEQAKAGVEALKAQLRQAGTVTSLHDQTSKATLAAAEAQLTKARADLALAEKDYSRFKELAATGAVSQQAFDNSRLKYDVAKATYMQAQSSLASAQAGLLQTQANQDNETAVQNKIAQAEAQLQEIQVYLDETELRAPFAGIITEKYIEAGAMVSTGTPIVAIQDPNDNWINIKVKETELSKYQINNIVSLEGKDPGLQLTGTIVDISKKPEFATYRATNERGETDIITFNIKIQVNSDQVRPGMRFRLVGGG
ncbi:MAG: HlyD family efflux transporter periplasmic adaptor subunit [Veillonellaceae bacterium]|jgi:HlyD family secretion protein|nr:HlyD family efflux transporter periplasmic adaptor subunit [Veillonellaceae bacterium]